MAVLLYRAGDQHIVRGVPCEFVRVPVKRIAEFVKQGWSTAVEGLYVQPGSSEESGEDHEGHQDPQPAQAEASAEVQAEETEPQAEPAPTPTAEQADTNGSGKLSNEEVRAAAKKAGIEKWKTARISKLKAELGYE